MDDRGSSFITVRRIPHGETCHSNSGIFPINFLRLVFFFFLFSSCFSRLFSLTLFRKVCFFFLSFFLRNSCCTCTTTSYFSLFLSLYLHKKNEKHIIIILKLNIICMESWTEIEIEPFCNRPLHKPELRDVCCYS